MDLQSIWIRSERHMRVDKKMLKDVIKLMDSCLGKVPQKKEGRVLEGTRQSMKRKISNDL